jgi:hypothetical protein
MAGESSVGSLRVPMTTPTSTALGSSCRRGRSVEAQCDERAGLGCGNGRVH